jgi:hypothetical protein
MRKPARPMWAVLSIVLAGCSSGDSSGGADRNADAKTTPKAAPVHGSGGSSGAAASGAGTKDAGFGNTTKQPQLTPVPDGGAKADASAPDTSNCGFVEIEPQVKKTVVPGNVLVVFDKSGSMKDDWNGMGSKWTVATQAVVQALTPLQNQITAGALFFPNPGTQGGCDVAAFDSGMQIGFMPGPQFIGAWNTFVSANGPNGATPTATAVQVADAALTAALPTLMGNTTVVLITDGEPTCPSQQEAASFDSQIFMTVGNWLTKKVQTHVVGLPGATGGGSGGAVDRLNAIATSGGTTMYIDPSDPMALQTEIAKIISQSVMTNFDSCTIGLPKTPPNPDDVHLVVVQGGVKQEVARDLGTGGGWTLNPQLTEIVLQGLFCELARKGEYDKISVAFGCIDLPPLPPPKPIG